MWCGWVNEAEMKQHFFTLIECYQATGSKLPFHVQWRRRSMPHTWSAEQIIGYDASTNRWNVAAGNSMPDSSLELEFRIDTRLGQMSNAPPAVDLGSFSYSDLVAQRKAATPPACSCDLFTVLMPYGCRCGGV